MKFKLNIAEFAEATPILRGVLASQSLDVGNAEPSVSEPMQADTTAVRVVCDDNCSIAIGTDPAVTKAGPLRLTAGVPEIFGVSAGDRIAVIHR